MTVGEAMERAEELRPGSRVAARTRQRWLCEVAKAFSISREFCVSAELLINLRKWAQNPSLHHTEAIVTQELSS